MPNNARGGIVRSPGQKEDGGNAHQNEKNNERGRDEKGQQRGDKGEGVRGRE
jgi:hypothetical protein